MLYSFTFTDAEILLLREELDRAIELAEKSQATIRLGMLQALKARIVWNVQDANRRKVNEGDFK